MKMKHVVAKSLLFFVGACACCAVPISLFPGLNTYCERGKDIVIAKCLSAPPVSERIGGKDGMYGVQVQILKVIKGARRLGECKVVTIYAMEPGDSYLLYSLGGSALGADFLALAELSVIPLPKSFELKELDGRNATQQVEHVFSRRLFALENELRPLHYEQSLLKKGLQERTDDLFASRLPVEIEKIHEGATEDTGRGPAYLDLQGKKLAWSQQEPGKTGYFYFRGGLNSETFFEFAPSTATSIEAFRNKPLNGRFYGAYTPGREDAFAWVGPDSITVSVGQVILVRSASDPSTVFIVRLVRQSEQREGGMLTFNYAVARR